MKVNLQKYFGFTKEVCCPHCQLLSLSGFDNYDLEKIENKEDWSNLGLPIKCNVCGENFIYRLKICCSKIEKR